MVNKISLLQFVLLGCYYMLVDIFSSLDYYTCLDEDLVKEIIRYLFFYTGLLGFCPNKGKNWIELCSFGVVGKILNKIIIEVILSSKGMRFGGLALGCYAIFWALLRCNYGGMIPYSFRVSRQLSSGLGLAFVWWSWCVLRSVFYNWKDFLAHLLPAGTPLFLCPLIVIIESIRIMIRPITLAVRLVANITMGHLVLALMGAKRVIRVMNLVSGAYVVFEFFVCGLQAYVFFLLVNLYRMDHPDCISYKK